MKEAIHPNKIIAREMQARNWSFEDLYKKSGLKTNVFSSKIDNLAAEGLSRAFGTSSEFWLNLQSTYDEWHERDRCLSAHTIGCAMSCGELAEEEAYFILRFAGRMGYEKAIKRLSNPIKNIRKWFIWIGGWENTELSQWDRGKPAWEIIEEIQGKKRIKNPTPISFFGHAITVYGRWLSVRCFGGSLNVSLFSRTTSHWMYWSPNGTPSHPDVKILIPKKRVGDYE